MKLLQLLAIASLLPFSQLFGQTSFSLTPNPVYGVPEGTMEVTGEATIRNLATTTDTFRWKRTIIRLEHDSLCFTNVADPYIDWFKLISERDFVLAPNQQGPMNVTLYDPYETGCCAIVQLKIKKLDLPVDSVTSLYYFRTCPALAVSNLQADDLKLFPNPVSQFFSLQNPVSITQMTLCDESGKMIRQIPTQPNNHYNVADLAPGAYFLVLQDDQGRIWKVLEFVKK